MPTYALGRMTHVWGPDAREFRPERWLDETSPTGLITVSAFKFNSFHAGPRMCLGMNLAMLEMKTLAASVLSKFQLRVDAADRVTYDRTQQLLIMRRHAHEGGSRSRSTAHGVGMPMTSLQLMQARSQLAPWIYRRDMVSGQLPPPLEHGPVEYLQQVLALTESPHVSARLRDDALILLTPPLKLDTAAFLIPEVQKMMGAKQQHSTLEKQDSLDDLINVKVEVDEVELQHQVTTYAAELHLRLVAKRKEEEERERRERRELRVQEERRKRLRAKGDTREWLLDEVPSYL
ncbi:hypothetical protein ATCC90586_001586 [Pythium insidiosum]|nr:hypothetical protein ATCC90586_001586 [Pythium insidiosum]